MIVLDASAAVSGLLNAGRARDLMGREQLHAPHLVDVEVVSALRRSTVTRRLGPEAASTSLNAWLRLGVIRHPMLPQLERVWQLRENVSAYDATYIALAEALDCTLVTADARLGRAPGPRCSITLVPR